MQRGSATVVVLWSIAIAAMVVAATQMVTWRTASLGRASMGQVQARGAARAGIERIISTLAYHTETPDPDDPMLLYRDLEYDWSGTLSSGSWEIQHAAEGLELKGPLDLHSRLNINAANSFQIQELPDMTIDVADAISDWIDEDDEVQGTGVESSFYEGRDMNYRPRNAPMKSIAELELVAGAWPESVRGEDWNLNNRLDPNENDGDLAFPVDDADDSLDPGWAGYLTAESVDSPLGHSGLPRIDLRSASREELVESIGLEDSQAQALLQFASGENPILGTLLAVDLAELVGGTSTSSTRRSGRSRSQNTQNENVIEPLSSDQLERIFAECTVTDFTGIEAVPGRVNVNTAGPEVLRILFDGDPGVAESIMALRQSRAEGIKSIVDLREVRRIQPEILAGVADQIDVTGWTFSVTSRGTSANGQEVEIHAILDRSSLPVIIRHFRED